MNKEIKINQTLTLRQVNGAVNSGQQNLSRKAAIGIVGAEISELLWVPKIHCQFSPRPILSHMDPVSIKTSYSLRSTLILSSHLCPGLPNSHFPSGITTKVPYEILVSPSHFSFPYGQCHPEPHITPGLSFVLNRFLITFVTQTILQSMYVVNVKFTLEKATKAQRGNRGIALLFL